AARSNAPVFITGESGTGKEVCAEAIHKHGPRAGGPFVPINCAAIPRDLMESELFGHVKGAFTGAVMDRSGAASLAEGGTLFLDEIAEMTPDMQTKLLRFLQNFTFTKVGGSKQETTNVRIICATNRDPLAEIQSGRFREDLFYRLHVLPIHMPPLRERGSDVTDIAELFLQRYAAEEDKAFSAFAEDAEAILRAYRWPGNIRQLQNVVRHVAVMNHGDQREVTAAMLPGELMHRRNEGGPTGETGGAIVPLSDVERGAIERAIAACAGNVPQAAAMLGVSPSTIYRKKMAWEETASLAG
ncbi:MAG: sigma-54-dependent Fis family transcriptional regulator, partial [Alphaproteobacteria bacterium]|nr:sigma-54-dependent Fis family transcriptional regulator [Alphaproteobacteria bacterium]